MLFRSHAELGGFLLHCDGNPRLLFTENDTNNERLFGTPNATPYVKDAFDNYVVAGRQDAVNPNQIGTKAAAHYRLTVAAGATETIRLRLSNAASQDPFGGQFDQMIEQRRQEAVNPARTGTKAAAHYRLTVAAGATEIIRLRLSNAASSDPFGRFDRIVEERRREADAFYQAITPDRKSTRLNSSHRSLSRMPSSA